MSTKHHINTVNRRVTAYLKTSPIPTSIKAVSPREIWRVIKSMKLQKSPGHDNITVVMLKKLPKTAILHLTKILNPVFKFQYFQGHGKQKTYLVL